MKPASHARSQRTAEGNTYSITSFPWLLAALLLSSYSRAIPNMGGNREISFRALRAPPCLTPISGDSSIKQAENVKPRTSQALTGASKRRIQMILPINDQWRIETDDQQWIVQELVGKKRPEWVNRSFNSTLTQAMKRLYDLRVRRIESDKPEEISREIEHLQREIEIFSNRFSLEECNA